MNERTWLLVLPLAVGLANFLPRAKATGDLLPQRRWLPEGIFSLWLVVTGLHLYALDYVYEFYIRSELFAPAAWVLAWTLFLRYSGNSVRLKYALTIPAILTPLLADSAGGTKTFLVLAGLNIAVYIAVGVMNRNNRLAPHLAYASLLLFVAGLPDNWMQSFAFSLTGAQCVMAGIAAYAIFWTAWLRDPKLAILGCIVLGSAVISVFHHYDGAGHWALQSMFVFLLLHSLRWNDKEHADANKVRMMAGVAWVIQSFVWMNSDSGRFWMPFIPGLLVLGIYCLCLPCRGVWRLSVVPAAATLVVLSGPCSATVNGVRSVPIGLLAVIASFLFLGFGTVAALTRHLWHKHEHELTAEARKQPR
jgi:hypothetical protein